MKKITEGHENSLDALEPSGPPADLRERVLKRASAALDRPGERDPWTRIYSSRPLRTAWAALVFGLLAANLLVPRRVRSYPEEPLTASSARQVPELREVASAPRIREELLAIDRLASGRPAAKVPAAGSGKKEKTS